MVDRAHVTPPQLTRSELAVALQAARGDSTAVIARRRKVSHKTVSNQLTAIFRKLSIDSRTELSARLRAV